jgi:hypothetical protein
MRTDTASCVSQPGQRQLRGTCGDDWALITASHCSRGCAFGDFDSNGDVDILVINLIIVQINDFGSPAYVVGFNSHFQGAGDIIKIPRSVVVIQGIGMVRKMGFEVEEVKMSV